MDRRQRGSVVQRQMPYVRKLLPWRATVPWNRPLSVTPDACCTVGGHWGAQPDPGRSKRQRLGVERIGYLGSGRVASAFDKHTTILTPGRGDGYSLSRMISSSPLG